MGGPRHHLSVLVGEGTEESVPRGLSHAREGPRGEAAQREVGAVERAVRHLRRASAILGSEQDGAEVSHRSGCIPHPRVVARAPGRAHEERQSRGTPHGPPRGACATAAPAREEPRGERQSHDAHTLRSAPPLGEEVARAASAFR